MDERRKKRVRRLKEVIVGLFIFFLLVPVILNSILFREFRDLKKRFDYLEDSFQILNDEIALYREKADLQAKVTLVEETETTAPDASLEEATEAESNETSASGSEDTKANSTLKEDITSSDEKESGPKVYLTFDDGPSENTDRILDILAEYDVKATFFTVGQTDAANESHYKRIVREGHTLAMHSYSHKYSKIYESEAAFKKDYRKISKLLRKYIGNKPLYYRFPGGSSNSVSSVSMKELAAFLDSEGVTYFDWNVASGDADKEPLTAEEIYKNVIDGVKGKDSAVVLMHDLATKGSTVEALPRIIKKLKAEGYVILPIDEKTEPVHHTIRK
ncbi:MAG: polysaccharide deacetylase [Lachnospiraceae bacterium]|nr:polysaccharide deacetylase [Lachnospiraceae bacterium]